VGVGSVGHAIVYGRVTVTSVTFLIPSPP
jgi:hypothetical protein